jgi:hypothetical protein
MEHIRNNHAMITDTVTTTVTIFPDKTPRWSFQVKLVDIDHIQEPEYIKQLNQHTVKLTSKTRPYQCTFCSFISTTTARANRHCVVHHSQQITYIDHQIYEVYCLPDHKSIISQFVLEIKTILKRINAANTTTHPIIKFAQSRQSFISMFSSAWSSIIRTTKPTDTPMTTIVPPQLVYTDNNGRYSLTLASATCVGVLQQFTRVMGLPPASDPSDNTPKWAGFRLTDPRM